MPVLGLIPEPPFDPKSWSGSAAPFFTALKSRGLLADAACINLSGAREAAQKLRAFSWPMARWKARYHASVPRFAALTDTVRREIAARRHTDAVLQVGAWFSSASATSAPCFSYHDGNAALWYRYYGRGLLSAAGERDHLAWERDVYSRLTGIFVMSSWLAASFTNDFGMPAGKVHVVGAGMNIRELPALPARDFSRPRFLLVGKDFVRKGGPFLLEAFRSVRKQVADAELVIVGPTLELQEPGVICAGFLSKSNPSDVVKLHELFLSATAVVLPSVYEPFGISLTEGMAYGLPCIAADRCAMPEIVRHGESGLVVPAENSAALAAAMLDLATSPDTAAEMGRKGRMRAEADFTWDAVTRKIQGVLRDQYKVS